MTKEEREQLDLHILLFGMLYGAGMIEKAQEEYQNEALDNIIGRILKILQLRKEKNNE